MQSHVTAMHKRGIRTGPLRASYCSLHCATLSSGRLFFFKSVTAGSFYREVLEFLHHPPRATRPASLPTPPDPPAPSRRRETVTPTN